VDNDKQKKTLPSILIVIRERDTNPIENLSIVSLGDMKSIKTTLEKSSYATMCVYACYREVRDVFMRI
jgi:hypothetical protein